MIGAVIYYGKNTLVAELPMGTLDLQMKLSSIGVGEPADRICSIKTRNPNPLPTGFKFGFLQYGRVEQKRYRLSAMPLSYITHVMGTVSPRG